MRNYYQSQLNKLDTTLIEMGSLLETAIGNALKSLKESSPEILTEAKAVEQEIDQKEKELENMCLKLILHQQPVARDFHLISSALKMITDMERIGDQADDIVQLSGHLTKGRDCAAMQVILQMGSEASKMVAGAINSYVKRDMQTANQVQNADDAVDSMFIRAKEQLVEMIKKEAAAAADAPDLLMVAKYFEGIGDHAVNMADWVVFAFTGKHNTPTIVKQQTKDGVNDEVLKDML